MKHLLIRWIAATLLALPCLAAAQRADTLLLNGKIVTLDARGSVRQALAVRDGRIAATGSNEEIRKLAGRGTRVIDLGGRTVIPGLIDSHLHGIRAGQTFGTEVNWIGAASIDEALARIRGAARSKPAGQWIIVAGGWTEQQFKEKRRPTQAELIAAAPNHPGWWMANPSGAWTRAARNSCSAARKPCGSIPWAVPGSCTTKRAAVRSSPENSPIWRCSRATT